MTDLAAQIESVSALAAPQRRALYAFVAHQLEPVSRDQAAAATGLARHTAKFHLDRLVDEGLLDVEYRRLDGRRGPGAGRPTKLYRRSTHEFDVSVPERRYALAAAVLAAAAEDSVAHGTPIRDAVHTAATAAGARAAHEDPGDLLTILGGLGFEPRAEAGVTMLVNCPFHRLATAHQDLTCGMALHLLRGLLAARGEDVARAALDPGPGRCCVVLAPEGQA